MVTAQFQAAAMRFINLWFFFFVWYSAVIALGSTFVGVLGWRNHFWCFLSGLTIGRKALLIKDSCPFAGAKKCFQWQSGARSIFLSSQSFVLLPGLYGPANALGNAPCDTTIIENSAVFQTQVDSTTDLSGSNGGHLELECQGRWWKNLCLNNSGRVWMKTSGD